MNHYDALIPLCPEVEQASKEWHYQQARIRYCEEIIRLHPNTPKARNAKWLIGEIKTQLGYPVGS